MAIQVAVYEKTVRNNKPACELALVTKRPSLAGTKINWSKIRQIFVKSSFTQDEIAAFGQDALVDLCEVREFSNGLIVNQFGKEPEHSATDRAKRAPRRTRRSASAGVPQYSEADWLAGEYGGGRPAQSTKNLYYDLKTAILDAFPVISHVQRKRNAGFYAKDGSALVCSVACSKRELDLVYATKKTTQLPLNDFVESRQQASRSGRGRHRSRLRQPSDIQQALEYVEMLYRQQDDGRATKSSVRRPAPQSDRKNAAGESVHARAGDVVHDKLSDGREHAIREIHLHAFKTLGESAPVRKAVQRQLSSLSRAGRIRRVGRGVYQRA